LIKSQKKDKIQQASPNGNQADPPWAGLMIGESGCLLLVKDMFINYLRKTQKNHFMPKLQKFRLYDLFTRFFRAEKTGGIILIVCTVFAICISNSSLGTSYLHFWHTHLNLSFTGVQLNYSLEDWINDGLMTIFFLMVGLEIEKELYEGELSDFGNALLPIVAAVGGMMVPALMHLSLNHGSPSQPGVGIPMATDIAFSLGVLSLLGKRVPPALKIFLTALAIIDDLGAVVLIAVFYTKGFSLLYLLAALGIFLLLWVFNRMKITTLWVYLLPGVIMWYCMLKSGVHATVSGVLLAFAIPFTRDPKRSPSHRLLLALHHPVNFLVIPLFALANTGVQLAENWYRELESSNSLGILAGLLLGKPVGIFIFCWSAVKLKYCKLPQGIHWKLLLGAAMLGGIGFTMSIFISNLAFQENQVLIENSKIAVFIASFTAAFAGLLILFFSSRKKADPAANMVGGPQSAG
jgi:Na+:H+ antiporter, NhaA family